MIAGVPGFQGLLNGLGAVLAFFYQYIPNYGVAIILLTLAIRVLLLPLAVKQIRSMHAMQTVQPKVKELQRKYKGDRQKLNEAMMALYKEHGVNPLSGCFPILAQFPVLIALFAVLRVPGGAVHIPHSSDPKQAAVVSSENSRLYNDIIQQHTSFLGANLLCSAQQAGKDVPVTAKPGEPVPLVKTLECGRGVPVRIPFYVFGLLMIGTTYYQQRQMQKASPAQSQQQQAMTRIMPVLFGVWGFIFPAGLVVYWTTTNVVQIVQQRFMLSQQPTTAPVAKAAASDDGSRGRRPASGPSKPKPKGAAGRPNQTPPRKRPSSSSGRAGSSGGVKRPAAGGPPRTGGTKAEGSNAGDRKKRRKR